MRSPGRGYGPPPPIDRPSRPYKVLCVSALHPKASDDVVRDTLYREYKKYGDISVRVIIEPDERVAYVYFRNFEMQEMQSIQSLVSSYSIKLQLSNPCTKADLKHQLHPTSQEDEA